MRFKQYFLSLNLNQRVGVLSLVFVILLLQVSVYLYNNRVIDSQDDFERYTSEELDTIFEPKTFTILPKYNPNYLTDYQGYRIGLSVDEIDRLFAFRSTGGKIYSLEQFVSVVAIDSIKLESVSKQLKFSKQYVKKNVTNPVASKRKNVIRDLNTVSAVELKKVKGVGDVLSERIIKYRNLLGGFDFNTQLHEVYGLDSLVVSNVLANFGVKSRPKREKVNINQASFKDILRLPYTDYQLTKKIFDYKNQVIKIQSIEELKNIQGVSEETFDKLIVYLTAK